MTAAEKITTLDLASKLFREWIDYLKESGTKFNPCPRQDLGEMFSSWNEEFRKALGKDLAELVKDTDDNGNLPF